MRLFGMRKFSKMSSDIVYQMEWFTNLVRSTPDTVEVIAAKAKKNEITKRCAKEQTDVDIEIDAKAKVQPVAKDAAVKEDKGTSLFGVPVKEAGSGADTNTNSNPFSAFSSEVKGEEAAAAEGSPKGGKSKKKKGGKSNKKKFSKKRKGGKRAKSQKKRR